MRRETGLRLSFIEKENNRHAVRGGCFFVPAGSGRRPRGFYAGRLLAGLLCRQIHAGGLYVSRFSAAALGAFMAVGKGRSSRSAREIREKSGEGADPGRARQRQIFISHT